MDSEAWWEAGGRQDQQCNISYIFYEMLFPLCFCLETHLPRYRNYYSIRPIRKYIQFTLVFSITELNNILGRVGELCKSLFLSKELLSSIN